MLKGDRLVYVESGLLFTKLDSAFVGASVSYKLLEKVEGCGIEVIQHFLSPPASMQG